MKNTNAEEGWRDGGWDSTAGVCEKKTQAHTPAMQINFKAEVEEISIPVGPGFLVLEKSKYTKVEREEITSLRERKKNSGFQLANKKAKQSIMSESPHSWLLLPGSSRMK